MILVLDHFVPHYDKDTGSRNTYNYLLLLRELGYLVRFAGFDPTRYEPYTSELEKKGIKVLNGRKPALIGWLKRNGRRLKCAYVCRPHVGQRYMSAIRRHTRAKIIYNCVDFGFLRELRRYLLEGDPNVLAHSLELQKQEFDLFARSDVVVTLSEYEKSLLQQSMPHKRAVVIPTIFYAGPFPLGHPAAFEERSALTFVGGFNHSPNVDGVLWFVQDILPIIRQSLPDVPVRIVGSNPPEVITGLQGDNVGVTGYIPDEELARCYASTRVVVAPLRYGAGVKGKIIEAIAHGIPLVTTGVGLEGIPESGETIAVADSPDAFAAAVVELYGNPDRWRAMREKQIEYASRYLSDSYAREMLQQVIAEAEKQGR